MADSPFAAASTRAAEAASSGHPAPRSWILWAVAVAGAGVVTGTMVLALAWAFSIAKGAQHGPPAVTTSGRAASDGVERKGRRLRSFRCKMHPP